MNPKLLPTIQMCLSIASCLGYLWVGDYRKAVYWAAAAILTASVTY